MPSYNGFGGKVEHGELPAQAAVRELKVRSVVLNVIPHSILLTKRRRSVVLRHHSTTAEHFFLSARVGRNGRFRLRFIVQTSTLELWSSLSFLLPFCRPTTAICLTRVVQDRRDATRVVLGYRQSDRRGFRNSRPQPPSYTIRFHVAR